MNKYFAELLGTFGLTLVVIVSLAGELPLAVPVAAALTLWLFVYTIGSISGAHLNPAVTVGIWSLGKIDIQDAVGYIIAQCAGAFGAWHVSRALVVPVQLSALNTTAVGFAELLGMFFFAFGIAAVVLGRVPAAFSGFIVGGSLLFGITLAASVSNGVLNPAVALGIGSFSAAYVIGPIVGSILGMWAFRFLSDPRKT